LANLFIASPTLLFTIILPIFLQGPVMSPFVQLDFPHEIQKLPKNAFKQTKTINSILQKIKQLVDWLVLISLL